VTDRALGEPLFQLSWLVAPNFELLTVEAQSRCNAQWQDLRIDLLMAGISLPEDVVSDAGSALADAAIAEGHGQTQGLDAAVTAGGSGAHEAGVVEARESAREQNLDGGQADAPGRPFGREARGCAALPWQREPCTECVFASALVLALTYVRRRTGPHGMG
jgi:hypothetical protein